jgi:hypothetical protein
MDISQDLLRYGKRDNSKPAEGAKAKIRENVLGIIGAENARVFDAFAGEGRMYRAVWHKAAYYVGCDRDWFPDDRLAYAGQLPNHPIDNRRVLRAIDLTRFNLFDLDAHGSMWEQFWIIAARRPCAPGEKIGIVITEGTGLKMNMGGASRDLAWIAGVKTHMPGMGSARDGLIEKALRRTVAKMGCKVLRRWEARGNKGSRVLYLGLILEALEQSE